MDGACQHLSLVLICGGIILNLKTVLKIYICIFLAMDILAYFGHHYGTVSLTYGPFLYNEQSRSSQELLFMIWTKVVNGSI